MTAATKVILLAASLAILTAGVASWDFARSAGVNREHARQFQRMSGGLGLRRDGLSAVVFHQFRSATGALHLRRVSIGWRLLLLPRTHRHRFVLRDRAKRTPLARIFSLRSHGENGGEPQQPDRFCFAASVTDSDEPEELVTISKLVLEISVW